MSRMRFILYLSLTLTLTALGCSSGNTSSEDTKGPNVPQNNPTPRRSQLLSNQGYSEELNDLLPEDARRILQGAEDLELLSLDPDVLWHKPNRGDEVVTADRYKSFRVLGKTKISEPGLKGEVLKSLYDALVDEPGAMGCFAPRHVLRATYKGKKVELVICFECQNFTGVAPSREVGGSIYGEPEELFNRILTLAGVPLGR